jgi:hypothetical protein
MPYCELCQHEYLDSYESCPFCARAAEERTASEVKPDLEEGAERTSPVLKASLGVVGLSLVGCVVYQLVTMLVVGPNVQWMTGQADAAACFIEQVDTEQAAAFYTAETDLLVGSVEDLVPSYMEEAPACPSDGTYAWDGSQGRLTCGTHGHHLESE